MMFNFECPNCHSHKYIDYGAASTLICYTPIYENGVNVNPDRNIHRTEIECCDCHKKYTIIQQYGEEDQIEGVISQ